MVGVGVSADEKLDGSRLDARQAERVLECVPARRDARAAVDKAPACVLLEQVRVHGPARAIRQRQAEPDDAIHDALGVRLVRRPLERPDLGRHGLRSLEGDDLRHRSTLPSAVPFANQPVGCYAPHSNRSESG